MPERERYALIREYKAKIDARERLARWGAHSMGIGWKIVDGEPTDTLALRVYVSKKRPSGRLSPHQEIPKTITFRPELSDERKRIYTDVIEIPPMSFQPVDPESRIRPVPGGVSGGTPGSTGTIGGWVWDTTDDTIVMLSNEHVFGHTAGTDILQPGTADGGTLPADKIGDVKRGIPRSTTGTNYVDCAIGDPDSTDIYDLRVLDIGPAVYAIDVPARDMLVEKYGQTTRHTYGEIIDNDWEGTVDGIYYFDDCIQLDPRAPSAIWSDSGDSGSLVFSRTPISEDSDIKPVVGLHFAGNGVQGVACKIQRVFNRLDLTTLCNGAFTSVSDSLFEVEAEEGMLEEAETRFAAPHRARLAVTRFRPLPFVRRERFTLRGRHFYAGISRDMQKRLRTSEKGRVITDVVDRHRAELLTLFAKDGDVRRSTLAALRPLVAGATTTSEVMRRKVTAEDIERLEMLGRELTEKGGPELKQALERLSSMRPQAEGLTMGRILEID